jgi:phenylpyruvate tautomerase PptA (4-oxalocrotonate tautomerase family)
MLFTSISTEAHQLTKSVVKLLPKVCKIGLATVVALPLFLGISSCSQAFVESVKDSTQRMSESMKKAQSFQSTLVNKYQESGISVEVNFTYTEKEWMRVINVQFTNTEFNKLTASERQKLAREVAELAKDHFALNLPEDSISVSFVDSQNYAVLQHNRVIGPYTFHPSDLAP